MKTNVRCRNFSYILPLGKLGDTPITLFVAK